MPREYDCPHCRKPIVTYMMVGETAHCRSCAKTSTVPGEAKESGGGLERVDGPHKPWPASIPAPPILVVTTPGLQGRRIVEYLGFCSGHAVMGTDILRDIAASITDIVGGRSGAYESRLQTALDAALLELGNRAQAMGANAVVGVDMEFGGLGSGGSLLMVAASGTAVIVEPVPASDEAPE